VVEPLYLGPRVAPATRGIGLQGTPPMALALLMVFVISVAMTTGFILGRVWQMRHDLEQRLEARFAVPDENG